MHSYNYNELIIILSKHRFHITIVSINNLLLYDRVFQLNTNSIMQICLAHRWKVIGDKNVVTMDFAVSQTTLKF